MQLLCNTPQNRESERETETETENEGREERVQGKGHSRDNAQNCLAQSDLVSGFPLSGYRECG